MDAKASIDEAIDDSSLSRELRAGIAAYRDRIAALGGYGTIVRATMPDGSMREGALIEAGYGGGQPAIEQADGRRFVVLDLASIEVVNPAEARR